MRSDDGVVYGAFVARLFLDCRFRAGVLGRLGPPVAEDPTYRRSLETALDVLAATHE